MVKLVLRAIHAHFILVSLVMSLLGCSSYRQNIMFKTGENFKPASIKQEALIAEKNYVIQKNDYLKLEVFSNKGERVIDPDGELLKEMGGGTQNTQRPQLTYLVNSEGIAKFPMIGEIKIDSLSLRQAEEILQKQYNQYFTDCFVALTFLNKRVIVLGAVGGQVIPLINQRVSLTEVLALSKGLANDAKAHNIRVLRGDQVFLVDFSTIQGFKSGNLVIEPGDIVYVEPVRRPFVEGFRDYGAIASILITLTSLIVVLTR
jgi:polysaccharide export outer membrane protein